MTTTFMKSPKYLFTSESVTEGHPDKMCDQISDAILDAMIKDDKSSRVACETAIKTGFVLTYGEVTTKTYVDIDALVREVVNDIGYDRGKKASMAPLVASWWRYPIRARTSPGAWIGTA